MKHIAVIFAGGTGQRMHTNAVPKQFLDVHGKPVLIYTLEQFERHPQVDAIILVCLKEWIGHAKALLERFRISKVARVVPGGERSGVYFSWNLCSQRYLGRSKYHCAYS